MATFYIGQRVRIVKTWARPEFLGCEGTVKKFESVKKGQLGVDGRRHVVDGEVSVAVDAEPVPYISYPYDALEPIQPEGYKIVAWEECLWQPPKPENEQPQKQTEEETA